MTMKKKRPIYEPPMAKDLSGQTATGDITPLGTCQPYGGHPYTGCNAGTSVGTPDCTTGLSVGDYPQCRSGSFAHSACLAGGQAG
jgi:hypothetical protein